MNLGSPSSLPRTFPVQLQGYISRDEWERITDNFRQLDTDATFIACAGEWVCCLCTGFFCIFCCHPAFHNLLVNDKLEKECRRINREHFSNNAVFQVNAGLDIIMSPEYLPPLGSPIVTASAQYVAPAIVVSPVIIEPTPVTAVSPMVLHQPRTAQYLVQEGVPPGSQITVTAPSGILVTLTIPNDAISGSILTYQY